MCHIRHEQDTQNAQDLHVMRSKGTPRNDEAEKKKKKKKEQPEEEGETEEAEKTRLDGV